jgi:hypothetical protein
MSRALERRAARERFERRLLQALLGQHLATAADLEDAVNQQIITGGHLTTNLWELGIVDGDALSRLSAKLVGIPEPEPIELAEIPASTLAKLPLQFVERKRVLPIGVVGRRLRVATCEPWDHLALGEAAYHAGFPVEPRYVAEVQLVRLLSRFYPIHLDARFRLDPPHVVAPPAQPQNDAEIAWQDLPELPADIATVIAQPGAPGLIDAAPEELVEEDAAEEERALEPIAGLDEAIAALEAAADRDTVGEVLARFALSHGKRVAVLIRRGTQWSGWIGAGVGVDPDRIKRFMVLAEPGTIFGLVAATRAHYLGPVVAHESHTQFFEALGPARPSSVALFPVHFRGRVVMAVYIDAGHDADVPTDVAEVLLLAQRTPGALARLVKQRLAQG